MAWVTYIDRSLCQSLTAPASGPGNGGAWRGVAASSLGASNSARARVTSVP